VKCPVQEKIMEHSVEVSLVPELHKEQEYWTKNHQLKYWRSAVK
jgi:hypothetical protein